MKINGKEIEFTEVDNLLMNMGAGLLPENLSQREIDMLQNKYGADWFNELGYEEPKFKKPKKLA